MLGTESGRDLDAPYLSVVVTARNDDHGGNLLRRMQVFVDAWINQAKRHNLASELIVVEWNPPAGRERLSTALRWPADTGPCQVRIIEVPAEVHARYRHASALPLYQMIAKNVGIRRARGEFILATNIDIVFSDELMEFLASRRLEHGKMYRIDRTDVMSDVPVDGTIDEQLAYCRNHLIRVFAREGAFPLTEDGHRELEEEDIARPESGIHFGNGWFPVEKWQPQEPFRWIGNEAEFLVTVPDGGAVLEIELEPGPGVGDTTGDLEITGPGGLMLGIFAIANRTKFGLVIPPPRGAKTQLIRLRVPNGGIPVTTDQRILNFKVFRCDWVKLANGSVRKTNVTMNSARPILGRLIAGRRKKRGLVAALLRGPRMYARAFRLLRARGADVFESGFEFFTGPGWSYLENSGEERFRWIERDAQVTIRTARNQRTLALLVEPGPAAGYQSFVLEIRSSGGRVLTRSPVDGITYVEFPIPAANGELLTLITSVIGGGRPVGRDRRDLQFRLFACGTGQSRVPNFPPTAVPERWLTLPAAYEARRVPPSEHHTRCDAAMGKPPFLHTYACGDFTLMSRRHWFDLRGYAELDQFSMHLDSLFCYAAHYSGAEEEVLKPPMRIYHIEHGVGSGWTPEGEESLNRRIAQQGIQSIPHDDVLWLIAQMRARRAPVVFNLDDWGLAALDLQETRPAKFETAILGS